MCVCSLSILLDFLLVFVLVVYADMDYWAVITSPIPASTTPAVEYHYPNSTVHVSQLLLLDEESKYASIWQNKPHTSVQVADLLLKAGASVDAKLEKGDTPLILASLSQILSTSICTLFLLFRICLLFVYDYR